MRFGIFWEVEFIGACYQGATGGGPQADPGGGETHEGV